jgi:hypothetical protein
VEMLAGSGNAQIKKILSGVQHLLPNRTSDLRHGNATTRAGNAKFTGTFSIVATSRIGIPA